MEREAPVNWIYWLAIAAFVILLLASLLSRRMMVGERLVGAYVGAAIIASISGVVALMLKAAGLL